MVTCHNCDLDNSNDSLFCTFCGTDLNDPKSAPKKHDGYVSPGPPKIIGNNLLIDADGDRKILIDEESDDSKISKDAKDLYKIISDAEKPDEPLCKFNFIGIDKEPEGIENAPKWIEK